MILKEENKTQNSDEKTYGVCGFGSPYSGKCDNKITKYELLIFNPALKDKIIDSLSGWVDCSSGVPSWIVGYCKRCEHVLVDSEITDEELKLILKL